MFTSLRVRLWLSYAILILTALLIVAMVLFIYLLRNPILYRQAIARLNAVETIVASRELGQFSPDLSRRLENAAQTFDVRILQFSQDQHLLVDANPGKFPELPFPQPAKLLRANPVTRDVDGKAWLYTLTQLPDQTWLMVTIQRPKVPVLAFLKDEFLPPFIQGGVIALFLSLIVAYFIARWIADPLQEIVTVAGNMPSEQIRPVIVRGPHEVQDLTRAFNAMVTRMQSSQNSQRDFVANVSHELKTPLTSIQGFAQAMLDGTADTPEVRKQAAEVIYNESARMHRMVLDLLEDKRLALRIALKHNRVLIAREILVEIYDTEYALQVRIDEFEESEWGTRLRAIMESIATLVEAEVNRFPDEVGHVLRSHHTLTGRLTHLAWKSRDALTDSAAFCKKLIGS